MTLSKGNLNLPLLLFKQVCFGLAVGYIFARVSRYIIRKVNNIDSGMSMALITASMLLSYSTSEFIGGNGYITVYLLGVLLGNIHFTEPLTTDTLRVLESEVLKYYLVSFEYLVFKY